MAFDYGVGPAMPKNQFRDADLNDQYQTINKAVTAGRPGALDYLFRMLDSMGGVNQQNMAYNQYQTMQPYMADSAKQGREMFSAGMPYMTDPYEHQRFQNQREQDMWGMQKPFMQQKYNFMNQQWTNPYINQSLLYGAQ